MNKIKKFLLNKKTILAVAFLAGISGAVYYAFRTTYVFTDSVIFDGFSTALLVLSAVNALALLGLYILKAERTVFSEKKIFGIIYIICIALTAVFFIFDTVNLIVAGGETFSVFGRMLISELPYLTAVFLIMLLAVVFPKMKNKAFKKTFSVVLAVGVIASAVLRLFPCNIYKITCDPMVIDSGDSYSVVFATNDRGTGYITYEFDGEERKIYDENDGRIKGDSKIHTVSVPKEELGGNTYKVGSVRVIDELSYGGRSGREVLSGEYTFNAPSGAKQTFLTVSDWHSKLGDAYKAIEYVGEYDGVILLGDAVPGVMFEDEIVKYIVEFGGALSKGEKPVVYVRGNHETRGPEAAKLSSYLGLDKFYYTANYGDYSFLVLDSGEDKEDSHREYGNMVCYGDYRRDMVDWLETVAVGEKTVALSHSPEICLEEDLNERAFSRLRELGIGQLVSGHRHTMEFYEENGLYVYLDGGHRDGVYTASKLTLEKDGYTLEAYNGNGEKVFEKTLGW